MGVAFPPGDREYVLIENVPVFHEVLEHETKGQLPYSSQAIDFIAARNNERVNIGEPPVIAVGHQARNGVERPVLGFLGNFTTGLRAGLNHLFATLAVYKDQADELRKYPRRSIEILQHGEKQFIINALALVGASEPALDLGVLCFTSDREEMATFTMENENEAKPEVTVPPELEAQILATFAKTDVFAYCHAQMKSAGDAEAQGDQTTMTEDDADKGDEGEDGVTDEAAKEEKQPEDDGKGATESEQKEEKKDEEADKFTALSAENAELQKRLRAMTRRQTLTDLELQGHAFSVDEELAAGDDLNDDQFNRLIVERVKKFTNRAPVGQKFTVAGVVSGGATSRSTDVERINRAKAKAREKNISFEQAWEQV